MARAKPDLASRPSYSTYVYIYTNKYNGQIYIFVEFGVWTWIMHGCPCKLAKDAPELVAAATYGLIVDVLFRLFTFMW